MSRGRRREDRSNVSSRMSDFTSVDVPSESGCLTLTDERCKAMTGQGSVGEGLILRWDYQPQVLEGKI